MSYVAPLALLFSVLFAGQLFAQQSAMAKKAEGNSGYDERSGLVLGLGAGLGYTPISHSVDPGTIEFKSKIERIAINTDLKAGFAVSRKFLVFWNSRFSLITNGSEVFDNEAYWQDPNADEVVFVNTTGGVGISYYFRSVFPSLYTTATIGYSTYSAPFNDGYNGPIGFGMAAGIGYEFASHFSIEGVVTYGRSSIDIVRTNAFSLNIVAGVLSL